MSNVVRKELDPSAVEKVLLKGDISSLNSQQRVEYYQKVCDVVGLNPLTKPFDFMNQGGKEVFYANKNCAEQLRQIHQISITISNREFKEGVYIVTAQAKLPSGRVDESTGVVATGTLKGDSLANALMKAETKAKRRVTLSVCGLGMLDETEVETIPGAQMKPATEKDVSPESSAVSADVPPPASTPHDHVAAAVLAMAQPDLFDDEPKAGPGPETIPYSGTRMIFKNPFYERAFSDIPLRELINTRDWMAREGMNQKEKFKQFFYRLSSYIDAASRKQGA